MKQLVTGLLRIRVRPYYLYQCDPILGSEHFRTPVKKGLEIIKGLRGFTTGYAVPTYVIDAPGGGGKIPLLPDSVSGRDGDNLLLQNYKGETFLSDQKEERTDKNRWHATAIKELLRVGITYDLRQDYSLRLSKTNC
jgi:L-lysine 2,3-aminomutase